jgi:hypothetical protein
MPLPRPRNESTSSKRFNINDAFIRTISSQMKKLVSSYGAKKEGETSHYSSIISPQLSLQIPPLEPKESLGIHEETKFPKKLIPILSSVDKSLKGIKKDLEKKNKGDKIEEKMFSSIKNFFSSKNKDQQKAISKRVPSPKQFLPKIPSKKTLAIGTALGLGSSSTLMNVLHSSSSSSSETNKDSGGNPPGFSGGEGFFDGILSKVLTTVLEGSAGIMGLKILKEKIFGLSKAGEVGEVAKGTEGLAEAAKATKVTTEGVKSGGDVAKLGGEGLGAALKASKLTKVMKAIPLIGEAAMVVEGAVDNSKEILDTGVLSFSTVGNRAKENANAAFDTKTDFFTLDRLSGALGLLQNAVIDAPLAIGTNISKGLDDLTGGKITGYVSDAFEQIASNGTQGFDGAGSKANTSGLTSNTPISQVNKESGLASSSTPIKEASKESGLNGVAPVTQANKESAWGGSVSSSSGYSFGGPVSTSSSTSTKENTSVSSEKKDVVKETINSTLDGLTSSTTTSTVNNNNSKVTPGINGLSVPSSSNLTFNDNSKLSQEKGKEKRKPFSLADINIGLDDINPIKMDWSSWTKPVNKVMNENVSEVINSPLKVIEKITESMPTGMSLEKMASDALKQLPGIPGLSELSEMSGAIADPMKYMKKLLGFGGEDEKDSKNESGLSNPSSNPMDFLKNLLGFGSEEIKTPSQGINGLTIPSSSSNLQNNSSEILNSIQGNSNLENKIPLLNNPQASSTSSLGSNNIGPNPFSYLEQLQQQTTLATTNKVETSSPIVVPVPPPNVVVNNSSSESKKPLSPYSPDPSSLRDLMAGNRLSFA